MRLLGDKARKLVGDEVMRLLGDEVVMPLRPPPCTANWVLAIGDWLLEDTTPPETDTPAELLPPPKDFIV